MEAGWSPGLTCGTLDTAGHEVRVTALIAAMAVVDRTGRDETGEERELPNLGWSVDRGLAAIWARVRQAQVADNLPVAPRRPFCERSAWDPNWCAVHDDDWGDDPRFTGCATARPDEYRWLGAESGWDYRKEEDHDDGA